MPDITITLSVPQAARAAEVLGKLLNADGSAATPAQVQTWLLRTLRGAVFQHERGKDVGVAEAAVEARLRQEGW